jgi:hypothetical protein
LEAQNFLKISGHAYSRYSPRKLHSQKPFVASCPPNFNDHTLSEVQTDLDFSDTDTKGSIPLLTFRPRSYEMYIQAKVDGRDKVIHTYSVLSKNQNCQHKRDLNLRQFPQWICHPYLLELMSNPGPYPGILLLDSTLDIHYQQDKFPDGCDMCIRFICQCDGDTTVMKNLVSTTTFWEKGEKKETSEPQKVKREDDNICQIPFASQVWANRLHSTQRYLRSAAKKVDPQDRAEHERRVRKQIERLTAVQEISYSNKTSDGGAAVLTPTPQLIVLWRFRQAKRGEQGHTTWRRLIPGDSGIDLSIDNVDFVKPDKRPDNDIDSMTVDTCFPQGWNHLHMPQIEMLSHSSYPQPHDHIESHGDPLQGHDHVNMSIRDGDFLGLGTLASLGDRTVAGADLGSISSAASTVAAAATIETHKVGDMGLNIHSGFPTHATGMVEVADMGIPTFPRTVISSQTGVLSKEESADFYGGHIGICMNMADLSTMAPDHDIELRLHEVDTEVGVVMDAGGAFDVHGNETLCATTGEQAELERHWQIYDHIYTQNNNISGGQDTMQYNTTHDPYLEASIRGKASVGLEEVDFGALEEQTQIASEKEPPNLPDTF